MLYIILYANKDYKTNIEFQQFIPSLEKYNKTSISDYIHSIMLNFYFIIIMYIVCLITFVVMISKIIYFIQSVYMYLLIYQNTNSIDNNITNFGNSLQKQISNSDKQSSLYFEQLTTFLENYEKIIMQNLEIPEIDSLRKLKHIINKLNECQDIAVVDKIIFLEPFIQLFFFEASYIGYKNLIDPKLFIDQTEFNAIKNKIILKPIEKLYNLYPFIQESNINTSVTEIYPYITDNYLLKNILPQTQLKQQEEKIKSIQQFFQDNLKEQYTYLKEYGYEHFQKLDNIENKFQTNQNQLIDYIINTMENQDNFKKNSVYIKFLNTEIITPYHEELDYQNTDTNPEMLKKIISKSLMKFSDYINLDDATVQISMNLYDIGNMLNHVIKLFYYGNKIVDIQEYEKFFYPKVIEFSFFNKNKLFNSSLVTLNSFFYDDNIDENDFLIQKLSLYYKNNYIISPLSQIALLNSKQKELQNYKNIPENLIKNYNITKLLYKNKAIEYIFFSIMTGALLLIANSVIKELLYMAIYKHIGNITIKKLNNMNINYHKNTDLSWTPDVIEKLISEYNSICISYFYTILIILLPFTIYYICQDLENKFTYEAMKYTMYHYIYIILFCFLLYLLTKSNRKITNIYDNMFFMFQAITFIILLAIFLYAQIKNVTEWNMLKQIFSTKIILGIMGFYLSIMTYHYLVINKKIYNIYPFLDNVSSLLNVIYTWPIGIVTFFSSFIMSSNVNNSFKDTIKIISSKNFVYSTAYFLLIGFFLLAVFQLILIANNTYIKCKIQMKDNTTNEYLLGQHDIYASYLTKIILTSVLRLVEFWCMLQIYLYIIENIISGKNLKKPESTIEKIYNFLETYPEIQKQYIECVNKFNSIIEDIVKPKHIDISNMELVEIQVNISKFSLEKNISANNILFKDLKFNLTNNKMILRGKSGAGKSTLFNIITGVYRDYLKPNEVKYVLRDKNNNYHIIDVLQIKQESILKKILYFPQNTFLPDKITVKEALLWFQDDANYGEIIFCLERARIFPEVQLNRKFATLSGGQQKRVLLACAFLKVLKNKFNLLLLDEYYVGLDKENRYVITDTMFHINQIFNNQYKDVRNENIHHICNLKLTPNNKKLSFLQKQYLNKNNRHNMGICSISHLPPQETDFYVDCKLDITNKQLEKANPDYIAENPFETYLSEKKDQQLPYPTQTIDNNGNSHITERK